MIILVRVVTIYGVPHGSILGPLLFNIYINDIFLFPDGLKMTNYADDCSLCEINDSIDDVIQLLEYDYLLYWYKPSYLKPNPDKWHLVMGDK